MPPRFPLEWKLGGYLGQSNMVVTTEDSAAADNRNSLLWSSNISVVLILTELRKLKF
jgi:hypothetical protein